MKSIIISYTLLLITTSTLFAQISLFKELNTQEEGSYPANFTELNGYTFFTVKTIDGYTLWKTDGTNVGTIQFSNLNISVSHQSLQTKTLQVINNELYYFVQSSISQIQLWKTDGINEILVHNNTFPTNLYFINNQLCYFLNSGVYKIENNQEVQIYGIPLISTPPVIPPISLQNQTIFFTTESSNFGGKLKIWKTNGTSSGTSLIKSLDSLVYVPDSYHQYKNLSIQIEEQAYFVVNRIFTLPNGSYNYITEIWKTDGLNTVRVHGFNQNCCRGDAIPLNLAKFKNKLLFLIYRYYILGSELWISDGTSGGTKNLKTLSTGYDSYNNKFGVLGDNFYFNDGELWQSDGTASGTTLFKDLNPSINSNPNYFKTIENKLFFKANNDEFWQSDGTIEGTKFIQNFAKPANSSNNYQVLPEFISTSSNQFYFSNYDEINGFELWKSDIAFQNLGILKNINTTTKGGLGSDKKLKVGNIWYFNGSDHRGAELWKTDGTPMGTVIVKDIAPNGYSTVIEEMVAVGTNIYFTAKLTNDDFSRLFKSDGTELGTVEIPLISGLTYGVNPNSLTVTSDKLFFKGNHSTGNVPWISDGTESGTHPLTSSNIFPISPSNFIGLGNKLLFTSSGLWITDGTQQNTYKLFGNDKYNVPLGAVCLVEFKGNIYFFSSYQIATGLDYKYALWKTDGTREGTNIIKEFPSTDQITNSYLLFLEKTSNRLYFRAGYNSIYGSQYFNLWTSDGTTNGTYFVKQIPFDIISINLKFASVGSKFYLFVTSPAYNGKLELWTSEGTAETTNKVLQKFGSLGTPVGVEWKNKLYFSYFDEAYGQELWSCDGTNSGTNLVGEIREGNKSSQVSSLMTFSDKLLFWGIDENRGKEIWQYRSILYSIQSGSWDSANTWSEGRVPTNDDFVIVKSGHKVNIPNDYQTIIRGVLTETGAVLNIPKNVTFIVNP